MNEIIYGDSLEVIPELDMEFDYCLVDPPYSIPSTNSWSKSGITGSQEMGDNMQRSFCMAMIRLLKKNPEFSCWIFCDYRTNSYFHYILKSMGLSKQSLIIWDKENPYCGNGLHYHRTMELIVYASNKKLKSSDYLGQDIITQKKISGSKKVHPFDKPPELAEKLIGRAKPGRLIDPCCGSGGLLVGAKRLGFDVLGIEANKEFAEIAQKRLDEVIPYTQSEIDALFDKGVNSDLFEQ